ncbi:hypothetical protein [Streptomyces sp. NPDC001404]|uniref:hypothetical protein n=1 Tax=Streptomyces sp. NPDC001404 TaxID=3364571 RepID=UPI00367B3E25
MMITPNPASPTPTGAPVFVSHVAPLRRDAAYDHLSKEAALPVEVHFHDSSTQPARLVLDPDQLASVLVQLEQADEMRRRALKEDTERDDQ